MIQFLSVFRRFLWRIRFLCFMIELNKKEFYASLNHLKIERVSKNVTFETLSAFKFFVNKCLVFFRRWNLEIHRKCFPTVLFLLPLWNMICWFCLETNHLPGNHLSRRRGLAYRYGEGQSLVCPLFSKSFNHFSEADTKWRLTMGEKLTS